MKYRIRFKAGATGADVEERVVEAWSIENDGTVFKVRDATSQANVILMIPADRLISAEKVNGA